MVILYLRVINTSDQIRQSKLFEVDVDAEAARLDDVIADLQGTIKNLEGRLSNEGYVNNAKPELVQEMRQRLHDWYLQVDAKFLREKDGAIPWAPSSN